MQAAGTHVEKTGDSEETGLMGKGLKFGILRNPLIIFLCNVIQILKICILGFIIKRCVLAIIQKITEVFQIPCYEQLSLG